MQVVLSAVFISLVNTILHEVVSLFAVLLVLSVHIKVCIREDLDSCRPVILVQRDTVPIVTLNLDL